MRLLLAVCGCPTVVEPFRKSIVQVKRCQQADFVSSTFECVRVRAACTKTLPYPAFPRKRESNPTMTLLPSGSRQYEEAPGDEAKALQHPALTICPTHQDGAARERGRLRGQRGRPEQQERRVPQGQPLWKGACAERKRNFSLRIEHRQRVPE